MSSADARPRSAREERPEQNFDPSRQAVLRAARSGPPTAEVNGPGVPTSGDALWRQRGPVLGPPYRIPGPGPSRPHVPAIEAVTDVVVDGFLPDEANGQDDNIIEGLPIVEAQKIDTIFGLSSVVAIVAALLPLPPRYLMIRKWTLLTRQN